MLKKYLQKDINITIPNKFRINIFRFIWYFIIFVAVLYIWATGGVKYYFACAPINDGLQTSKIKKAEIFKQNKAGDSMTFIKIGEYGFTLNAKILTPDDLTHPFRTEFYTALDDRHDARLLNALGSLRWFTIWGGDEDAEIIKVGDDKKYFVIHKATLKAAEVSLKQGDEYQITAQCAGLTKNTFVTFEEFFYQRRLETTFNKAMKGLERVIIQSQTDQQFKFHDFLQEGK